MQHNKRLRRIIMAPLAHMKLVKILLIIDQGFCIQTHFFIISFVSYRVL